MTAASTANTVESRLYLLEARAEIGDVMQRYADAADEKYRATIGKKPAEAILRAAQAQAACFTEDARWSGGRFGGEIQGREQLVLFFRESPWLFTAHHYGSPSFRFEAQGAFVRWRLFEIGVREPDTKLLLLSGVVAQKWTVASQGWRIADMAFERLYSVELAPNPDLLTCLVPTGATIERDR